MVRNVGLQRLALFLQAGENAGGGVSHWRSMRPTLLAAHLLLREVLHILQAAHQVLQLPLFRRQRCPGIRLLGEAKARNQGRIALVGFDRAVRFA